MYQQTYSPGSPRGGTFVPGGGRVGMAGGGSPYGAAGVAGGAVAVGGPGSPYNRTVVAAGGAGMVARPGLPSPPYYGGGVAEDDADCTTLCGPGGGAGAGAGGNAGCAGCVVATGPGSMAFVGPGQGEYVTETRFRYVGAGGNLSYVRPSTVLWGRILCMTLVPLLAVLLLYLLTQPGPRSTTVHSVDRETTSSRNDFVQPTAPPTQPPPVVEPQPEGECTFWGDPHIRTFDGGYPSFYGEGEFWIVSSTTVSIQGRYMGTKYTKGLAATNKVAIGGPFLKGHVIVVPCLEDGPILIDQQPRLESFGSYNIGDLATITYSDQGELVDKATKIWEKKIVHMDLPLGVHVEVFRWSNYLDLRIVMPRQPQQDGSCGNFNNDPSDDTTASVFSRIGARVEHGMLLFNHRADVRLSSVEAKLLELCPKAKYERALGVCPEELASFTRSPGEVQTKSCMLDVCFGDNEHALRMAKTLGF